MELHGFNSADILTMSAEFPSNFIHEVEESEDLMKHVGDVLYEGEYVDVETSDEPLTIALENRWGITNVFQLIYKVGKHWKLLSCLCKWVVPFLMGPLIFGVIKVIFHILTW